MIENQKNKKQPLKIKLEVLKTLPLFYQVLAEQAQNEGLAVIE